MTDEQIHALWTLQGMQGYEAAAFGWYREEVLRFARSIIAAELVAGANIALGEALRKITRD